MFAFDYINKEMSKKIYKRLLTDQNPDGGWGQGREGPCSTASETAMVVISIINWFKIYHGCSDVTAIGVLKKASIYLEKEIQDHFLWLDKTLYKIVNVEKTASLSAKLALSKLNLS